MIYLDEIYDGLPDSEYDFDREDEKGFREADYRAYYDAPDEFGNRIADLVDIDRFGGAMSGYDSKRDDDENPLAVITSVDLDGSTPTKLKLKVYGKYSNKDYQRTIYTSGGELDESDLEEKVRELVEKIDPLEREAKFEKQGISDMQDETIRMLTEAFGEENVGLQHSDKPVKMSFKNDGSVRLQITDLSAEAMMKIAEFASDNNLDLDLS